MCLWYRVFLVASVCVWLSEESAYAQAPEANLSGQVHALRQVLATMEAESAELQPRLEAAREQLADLTQQIDEATDRLEGTRRDLAALQTDENKIQAAITQSQAEQQRQLTTLEAATAELADVTAQLETTRAELAKTTDQQDALQARSAELADVTAQLETTRAELADVTRMRDAAQAPPEPNPQPQSSAANGAEPAGQPDPGTPLQRRDPAQVDAALALAPALPAEPERARLRSLLIDGRCTTEALRQVQDPINRQTLLVLVGRLGRC